MFPNIQSRLILFLKQKDKSRFIFSLKKNTIYIFLFNILTCILEMHIYPTHPPSARRPNKEFY